MYLLLAAHADGAALQQLTADGAPEPSTPEPRVVSAGDLAGVVRGLEARHPRWIWHRTQDWYPALLGAGVELERCYDLTLCGSILAHSEFTAHTGYAQAAEKLTQDDELHQPPRGLQPPAPPPEQGALFDAPAPGQRPARLESLTAELRLLLKSPALNPDSPQELMRALHRNGIEVKTTRQWELKESSHPAIVPLLEYKKLARLHAANGWAWLDTWVKDGRFQPEYVVGGVVSGRWASRGGGALQIPRQIRGAVHADPGHKLIVADASQLEPRVLVALAQDAKMAEAARDKDLYAGIAAQGFGGDRAKAKVALLGAIYGATTGESGRLMPQLARTYPRAVGFVEQAARDGEAGRTFTSRLGRSSPPPSDRWLQSQHSTTAEEQRRADSIARSRGRFTRNFVVQGSAADWAACWLAELRRRLRTMRSDGAAVGELVFFLHDEVMVHCPETAVGDCIKAIEDSATAAKELLFGRIPVEFPVSVAVVDSYDNAK
jgi:DNA polymerase-1